MISFTCSKTLRICTYIFIGSVLTFLVQYVVFQPKMNSAVKTSVKDTSKQSDPVISKSPLIAPPGLFIDDKQPSQTEGQPSQTLQVQGQPSSRISQDRPVDSQQVISQVPQMDFRKLALLTQWAKANMGQGPVGNMLQQMTQQSQNIPVNPVSNTLVSNGQYPSFQQGPNNQNVYGKMYPQFQGQNPIVNLPQYQGQVQKTNLLYSNINNNPSGQTMNSIVPGYMQNFPQPPINSNIFPGSRRNEALPPEVEGGPQTKVLRWNGKGWSQLEHFCAGKMSLNRTVLRSHVGTAIVYIHDLKDDKWVSGALKRDGMWDKGDVSVMINNLQTDPELGFIDIGSHVGTFSLVAALMGRQVVAVDPLVANVVRFCKSVQANNFTDKITIFYTAISDTYKKVSFKRDIGNIGGTRIVSAPIGVNTSNVYDPNFIDTVRLDDLVPYIPFKKAFIKMDVEEHEYEVVTSGVKFFQEIDVRGIVMEWMWHKTGKNGLKLRNYLLGLNFKPFTPDSRVALDINAYMTWPNDVLWRKMV